MSGFQAKDWEKLIYGNLLLLVRVRICASQVLFHTTLSLVLASVRFYRCYGICMHSVCGKSGIDFHWEWEIVLRAFVKCVLGGCAIALEVGCGESNMPWCNEWSNNIRALVFSVTELCCRCFPLQWDVRLWVWGWGDFKDCVHACVRQFVSDCIASFQAFLCARESLTGKVTQSQHITCRIFPTF